MGIKKNIVKENSYQDSVFLMQIAAELERMDTINSASLMMGTSANKDILRESDLLTDEGEKACDNDLIIAIEAGDSETIDQVMQTIEEKFISKQDYEEGTDFNPPTIESALKVLKDANLALISVAGRYAAREAHKALDNNLHVMIFSDNVTVEDEIILKNRALEKDLFLMGPDCGTAIINGVPLGFANRIPAGDIGIVAASGTGLQEVSVTIAKLGSGITQAFGTGGRDLTKEVGGLTMLKALEFLKNDISTKVIALISKPPDPEIAEKILDHAQLTAKPVVVCFLGSTAYSSHDNLHFTDTLEGAGLAASRLSKGETVAITEFTVNDIDNLIQETKKRINGRQKYVRGLYSGGTLCDEAIDILKKYGIFSYSNAGSDKKYFLKNPDSSYQHSLIDMGEDHFTRGRPHPMIDLNLKNKRMLAESEDEEVAVILLDVVLGYGANMDPVGAMRDTLKKTIIKKVIVASVCGTELDPQKYTKQAEALKDCGVIVLPTNAQAARFAAKIISNEKKR